MVGIDKHKMHICQGNLEVGGRETQDGGRSHVQLCLAIGYCMTRTVSGHEDRYIKWWPLANV